MLVVLLVFTQMLRHISSCRKAKTDEEFISHIEALADDIDLRAKTFNKDFKRVKSQLWWEENNNKRYIESYSICLDRDYNLEDGMFLMILVKEKVIRLCGLVYVNVEL
jgi:hypothetical protein